IPLAVAPGHVPAPALPLDGLQIAILMEHRRSAEGLREQIRSLGGGAEVCAAEAEAQHVLHGAAKPLLLLRYPFERPEWKEWATRLAAQPGAAVVLMPTLQERPEAAVALPAGSVHVLTWPVRNRGLRQALGACLGLRDAVGAGAQEPDRAPASAPE